MTRTTLPKLRTYFILSLLLVVVSQHNLIAQAPLSSENLAYQYEPNLEIKMRWLFAKHPTERLGTFYMEWQVANGEYRKYDFAYQWTDDYTSQLAGTFTSFDIDSVTLNRNRSRMIWEWETEYTDTQKILVVRVINEISGNTYYYDLPVDHPLDFQSSSLILRTTADSLPYFTPYISANTSIMATSTYLPQDTIAYLYAYNTDFDPALPPMATRTGDAPRSMEIIWMKEIALGQPLPVHEEHLYLLQTDTSSLQGISFRYVNTAFPKFNRAATLLEPTIYLSSRREQASMLEQPNPKIALDEFWLGAALQSPNKARAAIRFYYRGITATNRKFTTYKEGWKTDMGMIMTIFGPPGEVYRTTEEEIWIYRIPPNQEQVTFVFEKIKNIFTRQHYNLQRQPRYGELWQNQVDLWRKGLKQW